MEQYLVDFGAIGVFAIYLIYDKQVLMKKVLNVLENLVTKVDGINNGR